MLTLSYAIILVGDMERSLGFYRDGLGLLVTYHSPRWAEFSMHGVTLALHRIEDEGTKNLVPDARQPQFDGEDVTPDGTLIPDECRVPLDVKRVAKVPTVSPGECQLQFTVEDIEAFHREMVAKGIRCVQAPTDEGFGAKLALYADPDGLVVSVTDMPKKA